jgi:archaellum component FlaC
MTSVVTSSPEASADELSILKQELQSVLREKNLLKARIARLEDSSPRPPPVLSPTAKPPKTIVAELEQAEQYNASRRSEIDLILRSDLVANITESEQEAVILHEELQRCCQLRKDTEAALHDLNREFDRLRRKYSREVMQRNEELIQSLEEQITNEERATEQATEALRERQRSLRSDSVDNVRARLAQRIGALRTQIQRDEAEIDALDAQIAAKAREVEEMDARYETVG